MIKSIAINAGNNGDNQLIAGVAGKRIRVINIVLIPSALVTIKFTSGNGGAVLAGPMALTTNGLQPSFAGIDFAGWSGHFETANQGDDLTLNLNAATQCGGWINYILVP